MSDVPHLLKTIRNCWSHSGYEQTRLMQVLAMCKHYRACIQCNCVTDHNCAM